MSILRTGGLSVGVLTEKDCLLGTFVPAPGNRMLFRIADTGISFAVDPDAVFVSRHHAVAAAMKRGTRISPNVLSLRGLFVDEAGEQRVPDARFYTGIENLVEYHPVTRDFSAGDKSRFVAAVRAARG